MRGGPGAAPGEDRHELAEPTDCETLPDVGVDGGVIGRFPFCAGIAPARFASNSRGWSALRRIIWLCAALLLCSQAHAQTLRGDLSLLGQVREGDQTRETEAPNDMYGDLSLTGLHHGTSLGTFFRLERDFGTEDGASDFYAGFLRVPGAIPGLDVTLGRQFLSEGPGGTFVADAGKVKFDPGWPVSFTVFGGAPRYFEPTFSSEIQSQDEILFGGNVRTVRSKVANLSVGYLQLERDGDVLRQLVSGTASRAFTGLPGLPHVYGSVAYDADHQNLDLGTAGVDLFLSQPRLLLNVEGSYYKPQDQRNGVLTTDLDRREDAVFELFSLSDMIQFRGGLRYVVTPSLSAFGDYSYQRYDPSSGAKENGHMGSAGILWLPGGDGLEVVRLEYYLVDGKSGTVNGGKVYYESRVYEQLVFRTKLDITGYEKENNQQDTAISSLLGVGYVVLPGFVWELNFEANHNDRFEEDFRFGFLISYKFRQRIGLSRTDREAS